MEAACLAPSPSPCSGGTTEVRMTSAMDQVHQNRQMHRPPDRPPTNVRGGTQITSIRINTNSDGK